MNDMDKINLMSSYEQFLADHNRYTARRPLKFMPPPFEPSNRNNALDIRAADADVHSDMYGGTFYNPIHALTHLISTMYRADGKILVEVFYDRVVPPSEKERHLQKSTQFIIFQTGSKELRPKEK